MVIQTSNCDWHRLRLLLSDDLDESSRRETEQHLDTCETCQENLTVLAGEHEWWNDASEFLSRDDADPDDSRPQFQHSTLWDGSASDPEHPCADFVLEHLDPSDNPAMLGCLGAYEILEVIGQGGMGVVLKGYDRELNRYVAVKVLAPHLAASGAARKRFAREAQAAAAIVHPNVMAIHAVESANDLPYLVMPLITGETLQQRIDREGPLDLKDILRIGMQSAQALAAAHSQGLVHRDVKPANILLDGSVDRVLLSDFGLARTVDDATLTRSGVIAGTPHYMSPEQARGEAVDHRSDLFSLGSVIFAMSTGRPPFRAETPLGIARKIDDAQPRSINEVNADLPEWLDVITSRLMDKSKDDRIQTAAEAAGLFEQCLAHVQQPTAVRLPQTLVQKMRRRRLARTKPAFLTLTAIISTVTAGLLISQIPLAPATQPPDVPESPGPSSPQATGQAQQHIVPPMMNPNHVWGDGTRPLIDSLDAELRQLELEIEPLTASPEFTSVPSTSEEGSTSSPESNSQ